MPSPVSPALWRNRTIGLLGGSFNPAHEGHRHISLYALKMLGLDAVWWMVSPQNPLKSTRETAPMRERMRHAEHVAYHPRIVVTDIEARIGTRYTVDTLKKLQQIYPDTRFVWLMGADNMHQIHRWRGWQKIFSQVPVCILDRPPRGSAIRSCPAIERFRPFALDPVRAKTLAAHPVPAICLLHIPLNPQSSTHLRKTKQSK